MIDRSSASGEALVPGWLVRVAAVGWRVLVTLALGAVVVAIALRLGTVTASIVVALIVAATFAPVVQRLRGRGWGRARAATGASLAAFAIIAGAVTLVIVVFAPYVADVLRLLSAGVTAGKDWAAAQGASPELAALLGRIGDAASDAVGAGIAGFAAAAANVVTIGILGSFLTFFLLLDGDKTWAWILGMTDGWRREALTDGGQRAMDRTGGYIRGTAIMAGVNGLVAWIGLTLLGVPLAGPLAVLALIGGLVPYVGPAATTVLLTLVAVGTVGVTPAAILFLFIVVSTLVLGRVLARVVRGRALRIHPVFVVVALPIGFGLAGVAGVIVALPIVDFIQTMAATMITALGREPGRVGSVGSEDSAVPVWLDRLGQWSWRALVAIGLIAVGVATAVLIPAVILPVVLAVVLAATLDPAAAALRRRGLTRGQAALAVTVGTAIVVIVILVLTIASMIAPLQQIVASANAGAAASGVGAVGGTAFVAGIGDGLLSSAASVVVEAVAIVALTLVGAFLTFYFVRDGASLWHMFTDRIATDRRALLDDAGSRAAGVLGGYMVGTGAISLFGAATQFVVMAILGIPLALPLAVLSFFGGFIPYVGSLITTGFAFLVTVATGDTTDIIVMGLFTVIFNIVQGNFVAPLVYGRAVNLHPAIVLVAIPIGSDLAGIVGMFLAVPIAGVVATTWRSILEVLDLGPIGPREPPEVSASTDPALAADRDAIAAPSPAPTG